LRDSVELEWAGIPSVAIVHESMAGSARAMAEVSGMRGYEFVTVPYPHIPLAMWSDDEIAEVASELAPQLLDRLTEGGVT
jgi:hypothetical protein